MTFYDEKDKSETTVLVPVGENLLEAAHSNNVDLEGNHGPPSLDCNGLHRSLLKFSMRAPGMLSGPRAHPAMACWRQQPRPLGWLWAQGPARVHWHVQHAMSSLR